MRRTLFTAAFTALGLSVALAAEDTAFVTHFMENWDLDGDGQVTMAEATERRTDMFSAFDADENGVLEGEELAMMDEMRDAQRAEFGGNPGRGCGRAMGGMQRRGLDSNGDGNITDDEFLGALPRWFARMDANGDGVVTPEDLATP